MNAYEGPLTREMTRFDKLAEACRYYCRMVFPDLIEQDDRIVMVFPEGQRFIIKDRHEGDAVATLRLAIWLDAVETDLANLQG